MACNIVANDIFKTESSSSSMCTTIPIPVLMPNIHFRFFLILLVTFEVSPHKKVGNFSWGLVFCSGLERC